MLSIDEYLETVKTGVSDICAEQATVFSHPGLISSEQLPAHYSNTPAVYVTMAELSDSVPVETGQKDVLVTMMLYVLVVDVAHATRDMLARDIVSKLASLIPHNRWQMADVFPAKAIKMTDFYGLLRGHDYPQNDWRADPIVKAKALDLVGGGNDVTDIALWGVRWEQVLRLGDDLYAASGVVPNQVFVDEGLLADQQQAVFDLIYSDDQHIAQWWVGAVHHAVTDVTIFPVSG